MKRLKNVLVAAITLGVLTLTLTLTPTGQAVAQGSKPLLAQIVNTAVNPVPVAPVISAADRVHLEAGLNSPDCGGSRAMRRILADGTIEQPFVVPAGKVLILTDMVGAVGNFQNQFWEVGRIASLSVEFQTEPDQPRLFAWTTITGDSEASRITVVEAHSQTGVAGGPNATVCAGAGILSLGGGQNIARVEYASVQGYLISQ